MSNNPLFLESRATLKAQLRLSGARQGADFDAILDAALLKVRLGFIRRLTQARVTTLLSYTATATPATEFETVRAVATVTEMDWVRYELMATIPVMFQDASGDAADTWNREAPFRKEGASDLSRARDKLWAEIEQNLEMLAGGDDEGPSPVSAQSASLGPDTTPSRPFDSLYDQGIASASRTGVF